jgi:hypothetical protein
VAKEQSASTVERAQKNINQLIATRISEHKEKIWQAMQVLEA